MIRSLLGVVSVGRDASVAVGAYIGIVRDQFWSWLANDGYSLRLAEAVKRFEAADRLAEREAEEEVSAPAEPTCFNPQPGKHKFSHCDCDTAPDDLWLAETNALAKKTAEQESSPAADEDTASAGSPSFSGLSGGADWARGSSRAATAAGEPISVAARQRTEEAGAPPPVGAPAIPKPEYRYWYVEKPLSEADVRRIVRDEMSAYNTVVGDFFTRVGDNAAVALNKESSK